jgi:hypothetical protein
VRSRSRTQKVKTLLILQVVDQRKVGGQLLTVVWRHHEGLVLPYLLSCEEDLLTKSCTLPDIWSYRNYLIFKVIVELLNVFPFSTDAATVSREGIGTPGCVLGALYIVSGDRAELFR